MLSVANNTSVTQSHYPGPFIVHSLLFYIRFLFRFRVVLKKRNWYCQLMAMTCACTYKAKSCLVSALTVRTDGHHFNVVSVSVQRYGFSRVLYSRLNSLPTCKVIRSVRRRKKEGGCVTAWSVPQAKGRLDLRTALSVNTCLQWTMPKMLNDIPRLSVIEEWWNVLWNLKLRVLTGTRWTYLIWLLQSDAQIHVSSIPQTFH